MDITITREADQLVLVAGTDPETLHALAVAGKSLRSSRWKSHRQIDERMTEAMAEAREHNLPAIDVALNESAAKRIEDALHFRLNCTDRKTRPGSRLALRTLQRELALQLGIDPDRPLRSQKATQAKAA